MATVTEVEFGSKFQKLIAFTVNTAVYGDDYVQNTEVDKSGISGFGLPKLKHGIRLSRDGPTGDVIARQIEITLKSLRPPKFNKTINLPSSILLHQVNSELIKVLEAEDGIVVKPNQIKLMLKTKTVHDSETLDSLVAEGGDSVALNVMISKDVSTSPAPLTPTVADNKVLESTNTQEPFRLSEQVWSKIRGVLESEISDKIVTDSYIELFKAAEASK